MNQLRFQGQVLNLQPMRHTPAGIAVCELSLQHQSVVEQAQVQRHLDFEIDAVAMGDTAYRLSSVSIGDMLDIQGFIAPLRKSSSRLVLHIQTFKNRNGPASPTVLV